jgi:hypothetical protein
VLQIAQANQFSQFGTVSLDGAKIHANASRHSALSYEHADKIKVQLKREVQELLALAETTDKNGLPDGLVIPAEIARRKDQIKAIETAKAKIEARAKERYLREKAEFDAKIKAREAKETALGRKLGGQKPVPPVEAPQPQDQINLTDEDSRIMKTADGGYEQSYNAQAAVDTDSMLVVAAHVTQAGNDKQQVEPLLKKLQSQPEGLNAPDTVLADTGYYSERNVTACIEAGIEPRSPPDGKGIIRAGRNASANRNR